MLERFQRVKDHFSVEAMAHSDATGLARVRRESFKVVRCVLDDAYFCALVEVVRAVAQVLETGASTLEGCLCHSDVWTSKKPLPKKRKLLINRTRYAHCAWRAAWALGSLHLAWRQ